MCEPRAWIPRPLAGPLSAAFGLVLLTAAFVGRPSVGASTAEAPDSSDSVDKYWIMLEARPSASEGSADVRWRRPVAPSFLRRLHELGIRPLVRSRWLHAVSARLTPSTRKALQAHRFVRAVRPVVALGPLDRTRGGRVSPNPPAPDSSSAPRFRVPPLGNSAGPLTLMNARPPLARGLDGHGVRLGFLDAHYDGLRHPAFSELRADGRVAALRSFTAREQGGHHGVGVVSVAAGYAPGTLIGPAFGATILGATTEYTAFERNVEEDNFVAGLEWLYRQGADVVNVSVGYTTFDDGQHSYTPDDLDGDTAITTRAVDRAVQLGMTVVVSAGNGGCADPDACWFYVNTPADADSAITVGAVRPDSSLAPFSSRGPTADGRIKPDVVVQGEGVVAAWRDGQYAELGGTSFASPQVAAIAAQMLQVNPDLGPMDVRRLLRQTASQAQHPDTTRGWGVVNADLAVRSAEWRARKHPPDSLVVSAPYRRSPEPGLTVPVSAPRHTSELHVSLRAMAGRAVHEETYVAHPGPNRVSMDVSSLPPGLYRYRVTTNAGNRATGRISLVVP